MNYFTLDWEMRFDEETERSMSYSFHAEGVTSILAAFADALKACGFHHVSIGNALRDVADEILDEQDLPPKEEEGPPFTFSEEKLHFHIHKWKPLCEAPRDGTLILLYSQNTEMYDIVLWDAEDEVFYNQWRHTYYTGGLWTYLPLVTDGQLGDAKT